MSRSIEIHSDSYLINKIRHLNWGLIILITLVASIGFAALYSAAGGHFTPWASRQMLRFVVGALGMIAVALIDVRFWHRMAYPFYIVVFILLLIVEIMGHIGMGAQRWINLGFIQLQPSELMKIAVVMALARYFHATGTTNMRHITVLIIPLLMIALPVGLVMT